MGGFFVLLAFILKTWYNVLNSFLTSFQTKKSKQMKKISLFVAAMLLFVLGAMAQVINSFNAVSTTIACGGAASFTWTSTGASSANLTGGSISMMVPISGSSVLPGLTTTTTFTLTVYGTGGASVSESITINVTATYDTVAGVVTSKNVLVKDIVYSFISKDTLYLIDSGKVIVRDSAVVTVSAIDTAKTVSNRQHRRNTCTGDTVSSWTTSSTVDTMRGPVSFDTVHFQQITIIPNPHVGFGNLTMDEGQTHVFPNPSNGTFSISHAGNWSSSITDISGKTVYVGTGDNQTQVNTDLAPGVYILSLISERGVHVQRIIIQ